MGHRIAGVGLGLRWPLLEDILARAPRELAWLEIAPENYMGRGGRFRDGLERCATRFPIVTHGLALSLGGFDPLSDRYMQDLRGVLERTQTPWHSDHLCFSVVDGIAVHDLLPVPRNPSVARHIADRIRRAQDRLGLPLAIENISAYVEPPGSTMSEEEFLSEVLVRADCRLLLDVNNVFVNSHNHGFDPRKMIAALPLERVCQIHVAGHEATETGLIDTHAEPVRDEVYDLLEWTLARTGPVPILLERDDNFIDWTELCNEVRRLDVLARRAAKTATPTVCLEAHP